MANNRNSYQTGLDARYRKTDNKKLKSKELLNIALIFFDGCLIEKNEFDGFIKAKNYLVTDKEFGNDIRDFYKKQYMRDKDYREYKDYFQALKTVLDKVIPIIVARIKKKSR